MKSPTAVFQFRQDKILFGADATFLVNIENAESHQISGGAISRIFVYRTGVFRLRASIDNYHSDWLSLKVADGEVIDLMIAPPDGRWKRAFGLLGGSKPFITITELARATVP